MVSMWYRQKTENDLWVPQIPDGATYWFSVGRPFREIKEIIKSLEFATLGPKEEESGNHLGFDLKEKPLLKESLYALGRLMAKSSVLGFYFFAQDDVALELLWRRCICGHDRGEQGKKPTVFYRALISKGSYWGESQRYGLIFLEDSGILAVGTQNEKVKGYVLESRGLVTPGVHVPSGAYVAFGLDLLPREGTDEEKSVLPQDESPEQAIYVNELGLIFYRHKWGFNHEVKSGG